jgi:hypothetical protein
VDIIVCTWLLNYLLIAICCYYYDLFSPFYTVMSSA